MSGGMVYPRVCAGMVGTGGIGCGAFFALRGNHTLGREESRGGRLLDQRDYCKLHIIAHYVQRLTPSDFQVLPVGRVGDDDHGRRLLAEMRTDGFDVRLVKTTPGRTTLFSFCFLYPDGAGGNLTVDDSASGCVAPEDIRAAEPELAVLGAHGMVLAAPEAPLAARRELLALGTRYGAFRAASFTSDEMGEVRAERLLEQVDVLAVNADEAAALAGVPAATPPPDILRRLTASPAGLTVPRFVSLTAGAHGSWLWADGQTTHQPVLDVPVASTAGAGDAHFAGLLTGLSRGLTPGEAHLLAALTAAASVTSPHTINKDLDAAALRRLAADREIELTDGMLRLLEAAR